MLFGIRNISTYDVNKLFLLNSDIFDANMK
jgi:hypothetical protein